MEEERQALEKKLQEAETKKNAEAIAAEEERQRLEKDEKEKKEQQRLEKDEKEKKEQERPAEEEEARQEQERAEEEERQTLEEEQRKEEKLEVDDESGESGECDIHGTCLDKGEKAADETPDEDVCQGGECAAPDGPGGDDDDDFTVDDFHGAAATGDVESLRRYLKSKPEFAAQKDHNGWEPLHEASYGRHANVVELLLQLQNVNVNSRTSTDGGSPLWLAKDLAPDHPVVVSLKAAGGRVIAPGQTDIRPKQPE